MQRFCIIERTVDKRKLNKWIYKERDCRRTNSPKVVLLKVTNWWTMERENRELVRVVDLCECFSELIRSQTTQDCYVFNICERTTSIIV